MTTYTLSLEAAAIYYIIAWLAYSRDTLAKSTLLVDPSVDRLSVVIHSFREPHFELVLCALWGVTSVAWPRASEIERVNNMLRTTTC
jgi:hypothetical protein